MVPSNILQRTFQIQYRDGTGTCFTAEVDDRQYLITARHVVEGISVNDIVNIFHDNLWKNISVQLVGVGADEIDVAVLALHQRLSPLSPCPLADSTEYYLGQDVYFLGFPYGMRMTSSPGLNSGFPFPLVKKAIISSLQGVDSHNCMLLDGHNNPGFSGGPVVFCLPGTRTYKIAGIISGFLSTRQPVLDGEKDSSLAYDYNTGMINAFRSSDAMTLIRANPIGFPVGK